MFSSISLTTSTRQCFCKRCSSNQHIICMTCSLCANTTAIYVYLQYICMYIYAYLCVCNEDLYFYLWHLKNHYFTYSRLCRLLITIINSTLHYFKVTLIIFVLFFRICQTTSCWADGQANKVKFVCSSAKILYIHM